MTFKENSKTKQQRKNLHNCTGKCMKPALQEKKNSMIDLWLTSGIKLYVYCLWTDVSNKILPV